MSRSLKKGPYINVKLEKKVLAMNESGKKAVVKTWFNSGCKESKLVIDENFFKYCPDVRINLIVIIYDRSYCRLFDEIA